MTGIVERHPIRNPRTGETELADHLVAEWAAPVAPQGAAIRRWISRHPGIKGVGDGYAERLWDAYGCGLYDLLRKRDVLALAAVLDISKASAIVQAFGLLVDEVGALEDLDGLGMDGRTANAALRLFGADAGRRFREDPYLLTLLEPWPKVDTAALASGLLPSDTRRLLAAVDVAAARTFRTTESNLGGHTVVLRGPLRGRVREMLGRIAGGQADAAIDMALAKGLLVEVGPERYQARAPAHMEREIERAVAERLARPRLPVDRAMIAAVVAEVEREDGIRLATEQREAVSLALSSGVAVITGGAGTGKSTVVKAIRLAHLRAGRGDYAQVALSGRAAKRLREAAGGEALTVYRYLKDAELGRLAMRRGLLVVDEFSMVGTPDLWLLLTVTPLEVDVLLVGDPAQLPPIKAGNPAAVLAASHSVPRATLRVPQRQAESTGIPQVADRMRAGVLPELPPFDLAAPDRQGVFLWGCGEDDVPGCVLQAFETIVGAPARAPDRRAVERMHRADIQVLAMTRHGPAGAGELGDAIERRWMSAQESVHDWGFRIGSKLLWTRNSYDRPTGRVGSDGEEDTVDLMNGALGVIVRATSLGAEARFDDGVLSELKRADLSDMLRGWAITVHKAQGSAFRTVLIPVVRCRLLDRAMLYTAVTRARLTAVLVGDPGRIGRALTAPPLAWRRMQALNIDAAAQGMPV
ncbi:ATP-dependent DNA helicase [Paracraurococcus lichenis]|uniref:AAA family ATPase n=1 Tax=Paracraurococcus lichenis TaxID=3064888 RepID=A0ABT9E3S0_9PROT|nr:AAA family ATPase [Paracraurococcus sp. LOR1-02]MDO9710757.1 AAA family ATPase [Paracraurococcus sp. LOR1-02]